MLMKAIVYTKYGKPDVLLVKEVKKPTPKDDEVLIKVETSTVTPMDWKFREGKTFLARLIMTGLFRPKINILGVEFSGVIEEVGKNISVFKVNDNVFGRAKKAGAHAEYICVDEHEVALNPSNTTFEEASGITFGATTALCNLRDHAKIKEGQKVLINGASGGVGSFAVQIAKYYNAEITAVCSSINHDLVRSLGANNVIDYTKENFTSNGVKYDIIFDCVGKTKYSECKNSLNNGGIFLSTVLTFYLLVQMIISLLFTRKKAKFVLADFVPADLVFLKKLYEEGDIKTVIDKIYPIEEIIEAHEYAQKGHAKGKIIISVNKWHENTTRAHK